jgi:replicative DNA helicase
MKGSDINLERRFIGALLLDKTVWYDVEPIIDVFTDEVHRQIYEAIQQTKPDAIAVEHYLKSKGLNIDVADFISEASHDPEYHYELLIKDFQYRQVRDKLIDIVQSEADAWGMIERLESVGSLVPLMDRAVSKTTTQVLNSRGKEGNVAPLFLGDRDVDEWYSGANRRGYMELTIADSGHGKTQYAMWKVRHLLSQGYKVLWFQLEGYDVHTAEYFVDTPNRDNLLIADSLYNIEDIKAESKARNYEHDIDYIVIDYVQNVECKRMERMQAVEYISQQLTRLAKDCDVMVHLLSQVTINYTTRSGWKQEPTYGDVRWSQQLKQDAHVITSVFRPSRIESLRVGDAWVKDFRGDEVEYDSVFIRQAKMRHEQESWDRIHLIHKENGLVKRNNPAKDITAVYFD